MTNKIDMPATYFHPHYPIEAPQDIEKKTEFLHAIEQGNVSEVRKLLSCVDMVDKPALEAALELCQSSEPSPAIEDAYAIVRLLIEFGAIHIQDIQNSYLNIFDYAFAHNNYGLLFAINQYYHTLIHVQSSTWHAFFLRCDTEDFEFIANVYPKTFLQNGIQHAIYYDEKILFTNIRSELIIRYHDLYSENLVLPVVSPLHWLIYDPKYTKMLLAEEGDSFRKHSLVNEAIQILAQKRGNIACLPELLYCVTDSTCCIGSLHYAVSIKNHAFIEQFQQSKLAKQFPPSPLHTAIIARDLSQVEKELASPNLLTIDWFGNTALRVAIQRKFFPAVKLLVGTLSPDDLCFAASCSSIEIISFLTSLVTIDQNIVWEMFDRAGQNEPVMRTWIMQQYLFQYPEVLGERLIGHDNELWSLSIIQKLVQETKKDQKGTALLNSLLCYAVENRRPQIASFLLDQIDNSLLNFRYCYEILFKDFESEFIEKVIKKFSIPDYIFIESSWMEILHNHHPLLFGRFSKELFARAHVLCQQETSLDCVNYIETLITIAVHTGELSFVRQAYTMCTDLYKGFSKAIFKHLLKLVFIKGDQELESYCCEHIFQENGYAGLCVAIEVANENTMRTLKQLYAQRQIDVDFTKVYRHLLKSDNSAKKTTKEMLQQTIQWQRSDFTFDESEELAELLVASVRYLDFFTGPVTYISYKTSFLEIKKIFQAIHTYNFLLPTICTIPYSSLSVCDTVSWLLKLIFCDSMLINITLFSCEGIFDTLLSVIAKVSEPKDYSLLSTALQTASTTKEVCSLFEEHYPSPLIADPFYRAQIPAHQIVEVRDNEGRTELFHKARQGDASEVRKLLSLGYDPNSKDIFGCSVLEAAVCHLMAEQNSSNNADSSKSASSKSYTLVQLLVAQGACCNQTVLSYSNIFNFAFSTGNYGLLFALHSYYKPSIQVDESSLYSFLSRCEVSDLEFITEYYPILKQPYFYNRICKICISCQKSNLFRKCEQIAPRSFREVLRTYSVCSLLQVMPELAHFLIPFYATLHSNPRDLITSYLVTKQLLEAGMNCNEQDEYGYSALHHLANQNPANQNLNLLLLLLHYGADPYLSARDGMTPFALAQQRGNVAFLDLIKAFSARKSKDCAQDSCPQDSCLQEMLLQYQIEMASNNEGVLFSLFTQAVHERQFHIASILLDRISIIPNSHQFICTCDNQELVEKIINKFGFTDNFFTHLQSIVWFYKKHPTVFDQWKDTLYARGVDLWRQQQAARLQDSGIMYGLMGLALCMDNILLVKQCYKEFILSQDSMFYAASTFLAASIEVGFPQAIAYFCKKCSSMPPSEAYQMVISALQVENREVIGTLIQSYKTQNIVCNYGELYKNIFQCKGKEKILARAIALQRTDFAQNEAEELAALLLQVALDSPMLPLIVKQISVMPFSLLKQKVQSIVECTENLSRLCRVPYGNRSLHKTVHWMITGIFLYCTRMNPKLFSQKQVFDTIFDLVASVRRGEDYESLFVALQVAPTIEMARLAFTAAQVLNEGSTVRPSKENFLQKTMIEQKQWLSFALVYRDRAFIQHCYHIIKNHTTHQKILFEALCVLKAIGVKRYTSELENSLVTLLEKILQVYQDENIKIAALSAYASIHTHCHTPMLVSFFISQLEEARNAKCFDYEAELSLFLGMEYEWTSGQECEKVVEALLCGLQSESTKVRMNTVYALTAMPNEKGLIASLEVVQSSTWDMQLGSFGKNKHAITGLWNTFLYRPAAIHDNRHAMINRILLQLVGVYEKESSFCALVEQKRSSCSHHDFVESAFTRMPFDSLRYVNITMAYPSQTDLIRGLSMRKGGIKFRESIKDLFCKGAGSSQLTDHEACAASSTWNKIGHMFASHNKELYFGNEWGSTYFSVDHHGVVSDSALIIFPASYYQKEYISGQARIEKEGSFNNVLYRGIPKCWIKAVYLPIRFKQDIDLLAGNTALEDAQFTSDLFKGDTIKELEMVRRTLKAYEIDRTREPVKSVMFIEKIRYFPAINAKQVGEVLLQDGIRFASIEEIKKETAELELKKHVLIHNWYANPWRFATQDEFLVKATDGEFTAHADLFFTMLPESIPDLNKARKFLRELHTDRFVPFRALLRVAALLYHVGEQAKDIINENPSFYGLAREDIPVVLALIRSMHRQTTQAFADINPMRKDVSSEVFAHLLNELQRVVT